MVQSFPKVEQTHLKLNKINLWKFFWQMLILFGVVLALFDTFCLSLVLFDLVSFIYSFWSDVVVGLALYQPVLSKPLTVCAPSTSISSCDDDDDNAFINNDDDDDDDDDDEDDNDDDDDDDADDDNDNDSIHYLIV